MKKMPLIVLLFLIFLVIISGIVDSDGIQTPEYEKQVHHDMLLSPPYHLREPPQAQHLIVRISGPGLAVDERILLEDNILKSEEMVQRLDKAALRLKGKGENVSEFEQMIGNYSFLVSEARLYFELAENSSSVYDEQRYMDLSRDNIILANSNLKPIFDNVKRYLQIPVVFYDNSSLIAEGSGLVILSGDLDADIFLSRGKFSVVDLAGDVVINTETEYMQLFAPEGALVPAPVPGTPAPQKIYSNVDVTGNISISGSAFSAAIRAEMISLQATGTGSAELVGDGTYYFDYGPFRNSEKSWSVPIFENE
jgi:hypothetical protein